jgi:hypothetical protein
MMTRGGGVFCIGGSGGRIDTRSRELVDQEKTIAGNLVGTDNELGEHRERVVGESHCEYPTIRSPRSPQTPWDLWDGRIEGCAVLVP